jgi:hypothetical protein
MTTYSSFEEIPSDKLTLTVAVEPPRIARVLSDSSLETIQRYLPGNYEAVQTQYGIFIIGYDNAGWTLDDYVIPRLASGLHTAREIVR